MGDSIEKFIEALRKKGHKVTPQRIELFRVIKSSKHPTAEEIYQLVKKDYPTVSPATVYKTIELLRGMGEIQEISVVNGKIRYETNMTPHVNIHCLECGRVEDIYLEKIKELDDELMDKSKYEIVSQSHDYFGYCQECKKKKLSE